MFRMQHYPDKDTFPSHIFNSAFQASDIDIFPPRKRDNINQRDRLNRASDFFVYRIDL